MSDLAQSLIFPFPIRLSLTLALLLPGFAYGQAVPLAQAQDHTAALQLQNIQPIPNRGQERDPQAAEVFNSKLKADRLAIEAPISEDRQLARQVSEQRARQLEIVIHTPRQGRVVNGKPARSFSDPTRFQYQVALILTGYTNALDGQFCGGSLIDPSWVLTAAHCIRDTTQPADIEVYVGSYVLSQGGHLITLSKIVRNEQYNDDETHPINDIALLKLSSPVQGLRIMELADSAREQQLSSFTSNAIISGWGDTRFGGMGSDDLLFANVGIVSTQVCNNPAHYNGLISNSMVCAGSGEADACQGDSGGPLVMQDQNGTWYQEGIVSWGEGCAQPNRPGVYARIPYFAVWLKQNMH